ncbi:MAG: hypothetical protein P8X93_07385 [Gammaproteobacteria bacterium]
MIKQNAHKEVRWNFLRTSLITEQHQQNFLNQHETLPGYNHQTVVYEVLI